MESTKSLEAVKKLLAPKKLSYVEEKVFLQTLGGQLYREMALETGYEEGYLKDVGSQLWHSLSAKLGRQVTKKNLRAILTEVCELKSFVINHYLQPGDAFAKLDFPGSPLPVGSTFYVERPPVEDLALSTLHQTGSLIRIKAPLCMGKTSLINHLLGVAHQAGIYPVLVDMQQADTAALNNLDQFLRWFCWTIGQQLNMDAKFDEYWIESAGSKLGCTTYLQEYILKWVSQPIVVAIDKIHYLMRYPELASNFFPMLRSWYEQARVREVWQKLRLIIAHSTQLEMPLQVNQSPFNVGLPLTLSEFTAAQINDLAERYELHKVGIHDFPALKPLLKLVGGHPYLLQLAFYWLRSGHLTLAQLLQEAPTDQGIYGEHLRYLWLTLQRDETLMQAFHTVLSSPLPVALDTAIAYQLEGMGLVQIHGMKVSLRYELYRQYFSAHLEGTYG
ncbi:MAG: AAA-like domain-containing protein [Synechococcales bacterium]|nr:AAA-like domain-containing protein [Synechococcales bacterium]